MWVTRCLPLCRAAIASHPLAVGIPAAVTTIGTAAALAVMLSPRPAKPQLPCGCHQVWVAPVLPMTPHDYRQAIATAGAVALAGIPLADAPGGSIGGPPATIVPTNLVPAHFVVPPPQNGPHTKTTPPGPSTSPPGPVPVPEPASLGVLATALAALALCRRGRRSS